MQQQSSALEGGDDTYGFDSTLNGARHMDQGDRLAGFRNEFYIPILHGKESIYFTGNSLGLQPKSTQDYVLSDLQDWANFGVEGHFLGRNPWITYHERFPKMMAPMLGATEEEIVIMNQLTINLHLLLVSFYRPTKHRYKILCESKAFPSDQYALQSQARLSGLDPREAILEVAPRPGESIVRNEDIIAAISEHGNSIAVVMIGGVNYYTGQVFDMESITAAAHSAGAFCGFDLAHAVGNVPLDLHRWGVDFACWCSYKYLNAGPGAVAGAYIHQRHHTNPALLRLAGWSGTKPEKRFLMGNEFDPILSADGWQLSTTPLLNMSALNASLHIFQEAGFANILMKARRLSAYLFFTLDRINASCPRKMIDVITPRQEDQHGCQVSILMNEKGKETFDGLRGSGVIVDWREPNVIRAAPVPLYNTFEEVYTFGEIIKAILLK